MSIKGELSNPYGDGKASKKIADILEFGYTKVQDKYIVKNESPALYEAGDCSVNAKQRVPLNNHYIWDNSVIAITVKKVEY